MTIRHLVEFKTRLIYSLLFFIIVFILLFIKAEKLYTYLAEPLLQQLPRASSLIATGVTTPFLVPMKLSFMVAIYLSMPYWLYQIWRFVAPGLYRQEKVSVLPIIIVSCILFYLGLAFAFLVICPLALKFFVQCAPQQVMVMTDIASYLDFILNMLFAAGIAFQIPIVTKVLIKFKLVTKQKLSRLRPVIIVLAFVLGMLLTPPDVISQILLAVPMWLLFELGLLFCQD